MKKISFLSDTSLSSTDRGILDILKKEYLAMLVLMKGTDTCFFESVNSSIAEDMAAYLSTGVSYDELITEYINRYVYIEDRTAAANILCRQSVEDSVTEGAPLHFTLRRCAPDGTTPYTRIDVRFFADSDSRPAYLLCFSDVDTSVRQELLQKDQLKQAYLEVEKASQAKNQFMHNMSHDIRTPLNAIVGYTTVGSDHVDDPNAMKDYLSKIYISSQHLLHIVNEILDLGELESENIHINEVMLTMRSLVGDVLNTVDASVKDKMLHLHLSIDDNDHTPLVMDSNHIEKVLVNVLSNSIKFTESGGDIFLDVTRTPTSVLDILHYQFIIRDTGIGISDEFIGKVFDPYSRERTSTESRQEGVGIGLTVAKNILDVLHGTINIESKKDVGTTVTIGIDVSTNLHSDVVQKSAIHKNDVVPATNIIKGKRILVVDDSKVNRDIATAILEGFKAKIETASDGELAVSLFETSKAGYYDLILMDIQMPHVDGFEATRQIRSIKRDDARTIPIIALTADVFETTRHSAINAGMNDFLTKPINVKSMTSMLVKYFSKGKEAAD